MNRKLLFTLVMMLFGLATPALAETLTVYEGEYSSAYVPIYGFYADAFLKCEYVIPAADLEEMAGGSITSLTWYTNTPATASWGNANFQVFVKEVDGATIDAYQGPGQIVFEGPLDGTGETIVIEFEEPYLYDGGNLLVGVYNTVKGTYKSSSFKGQEITGAAVQGYSYNSLDEVSTNQRNFIPQTTFEFIPGENYVAKPKNVAVGNITNKSAVVTWEGEALSYSLRYQQVNNAAKATTGEAEWIEVNDATSPYTLDGLHSNATYQVEVMAIYEDAESDWTRPLEFSTLSNYELPTNVEVPEVTGNTATVTWDGNLESYNLRYRTAAVVNGVTETFEGIANDEMPEGWTTIDNDGDGYNWGVYTYVDQTTGETNTCLVSESYINNYGALTPDNWAITPLCKLGAQVSFDAYGQDADWAAEVFRVYVSTTGTTVADFQPISEDITATGVQTTYTFDIPAELVGQMGYIAIRHYNVTDMFRLNVKNFYMAGEEEDVPEGEWVEIDGVASPYIIKNLEVATTYEVQVQGNYEERLITDWTESVIFTTLEEEDEEGGIEELYMVGSFNGWNQTEEGGRIPFELANDQFIATADLEAGAEFKLITPVEGGWRWFGGIDENQVGYFLINEGLLGIGLDLVEGSNFRIEEAGSYTITVVESPILRGLNEPLQMVVTKNLPTAITDLNSDSSNNTWYNIQGMKLQGVPTVPGIYINNGKKVIVK